MAADLQDAQGSFVPGFGPPKRDLDDRKNIKLSLPVRQHLQLHAMRLRAGGTISDLVEEALADFFARKRAAQDEPAGQLVAEPEATGVVEAP
jgi:hypothetical protein